MMGLVEYTEELKQLGFTVKELAIDYGYASRTYYSVMDAANVRILVFELKPHLGFNNNFDAFAELSDITKEPLMKLTRKLLVGD